MFDVGSFPYFLLIVLPILLVWLSSGEEADDNELTIISGLWLLVTIPILVRYSAPQHLILLNITGFVFSIRYISHYRIQRSWDRKFMYWRTVFYMTTLAIYGWLFASFAWLAFVTLR